MIWVTIVALAIHSADVANVVDGEQRQRAELRAVRERLIRRHAEQLAEVKELMKEVEETQRRHAEVMKELAKRKK